MSQRNASADFNPKLVLLGGALLLTAVILWSVREWVPSWAAPGVTATVEFSTTSERDDARVTRAFEHARRTSVADAMLEPQPNWGQVRHTRLSVRAPTEREALAQASAITESMQTAFTREGRGELLANVRRRALPIDDANTAFLREAVRVGAFAVGLIAVALLALSWRRYQAGPGRLPSKVWWGVLAAVGFTIGPYLLPVGVVVTLIVMAIPGLISGVIVVKTIESQRAASWPSARGRITKSQVKAEHRRQSGETTRVVNIPVVEYDYSVGGQRFSGKRISIGDAASIGAETTETLERYSVGAEVPVYYNPQKPEEAVLERDPPLPPVWMYLIAAAVFAAGLAVLAVFANIGALAEGLAAYLPQKAQPVPMVFFALGGVMTLLILWASQRQRLAAARWPHTVGSIVSSTVESYRTRVGGARSGTRVTLYEPVIEYSYRVNDREYRGTRLSFGGKVAGSQQAAAAVVARYQPESAVVVRYDPANPTDAVLETTVAHAALQLAVGLGFLAAAVFFSGAFR